MDSSIRSWDEKIRIFEYTSLQVAEKVFPCAKKELQDGTIHLCKLIDMQVEVRCRGLFGWGRSRWVFFLISFIYIYFFPPRFRPNIFFVRNPFPRGHGSLHVSVYVILENLCWSFCIILSAAAFV